MEMRFFTTESVLVVRIYAFVAAMVYALALFFIKRCKSSPMTISFIRASSNVILSLIQQYFTKEDYFKGWSSLNWSMARALIAMFSTVLAIYIVRYIKISVFAVMTRLEIIIVFFMGLHFLGNKFDPKILVAGGISIMGVILVISPGLLGLSQDAKDNLELSFTPGELLGLLLTLGWLVTDSSAIIISSKVMGLVSVGQSLIHMNMVIAFTSGIGLTFSSHGPEFRSEDLHLYVGIGICYFIGQMLLSEAYRVDKNPTVITVIGCFYPISCLLLDVIFLGTRPSFVNLCGCIVVTASSVWAVFLKNKSSAPAKGKDQTAEIAVIGEKTNVDK